MRKKEEKKGDIQKVSILIILNNFIVMFGFGATFAMYRTILGSRMDQLVTDMVC